MAKKLRISYRLSPETKKMISDMAQQHNVSETLIIEVSVRSMYENRLPLDMAFPRQSPTPPPPQKSLTPD